MREETKRQVREFYAKASRFSGAVIAVVAAWFAVLLVMRLLTQEPFGEELMMMIFAGIMAAVLLSARAEDPQKSKSQKPD
jgi:hypothetical protein